VLKKRFYAVAFISWLLIILFLSLYSFRGNRIITFDISNLDKVVHFVFYFIAGALGFLYLKELWATGKVPMSKLSRLAIFLIIFGIIIEVIQEKFTTVRSGEFYDALANGIGAICGVFILYALFYRQRGLK